MEYQLLRADFDVIGHQPVLSSTLMLRVKDGVENIDQKLTMMGYGQLDNGIYRSNVDLGVRLHLNSQNGLNYRLHATADKSEGYSSEDLDVIVGKYSGALKINFDVLETKE